jgi:dimeric dUTPase (all-alpha-NTP-PPase superfamily)
MMDAPSNARAGHSGVGEDRLAVMLRLQREFQENILGHGNLSSLYGGARAEYFRTQALSLIFEVGEAGNEIAWKPWATSDHVNHRAYRAELIDVMHFLFNLMLLDDMTPDEIYEGYVAKQRVNRQRQAYGYDGVSSKCPGCKRAYDDPAVRCARVNMGDPSDPEGDNPEPAWCEVYGALDTSVLRP